MLFVVVLLPKGIVFVARFSHTESFISLQIGGLNWPQRLPTQKAIVLVKSMTGKEGTLLMISNLFYASYTLIGEVNQPMKDRKKKKSRDIPVHLLPVMLFANTIAFVSHESAHCSSENQCSRVVWGLPLARLSRLSS